MHLTTIVTKKGKEYKGYVDKTHLKKGKRVAYVELLLNNRRLKKIYIDDMKNAVTEHERVSVDQPDATKDNLEEWRWIIEKWG
mgnify:CR=1 FL=1